MLKHLLSLLSLHLNLHLSKPLFLSLILDPLLSCLDIGLMVDPHQLILGLLDVVRL